jgi:antibiotic biosynthesis monooxygenase (ABM) superfamily enzyme
MAKIRIINVVATECPPEDEAKFNKWYNEVHIPMLFKYKGMKKVTRYKKMDGKSRMPKYLAVYEYDTREALDAISQSQEYKDAIAEMQETQQDLPFEIKWASGYEPIKTWEK